MNLGPDPAPAVPALTAALDVTPGPDANEQEREAVLRPFNMSVIALGNVGPLASSAVPKLIQCLSLPDDRAGNETTAEVREKAAEALGKTGPRAAAALSELRRVAASDTSAKVRIQAAAAVERIE